MACSLLQKDNTKNLEEVFRSEERASSALEIMQVILSGTLAFEILDRITGEVPALCLLVNLMLRSFSGQSWIQNGVKLIFCLL